MLTFEFKALTEEDCKALEDAFIDYAGKKATQYQKTIGLHQLYVVDSY